MRRGRVSNSRVHGGIVILGLIGRPIGRVGRIRISSVLLTVWHG